MCAARPCGRDDGNTAEVRVRARPGRPEARAGKLRAAMDGGMEREDLGGGTGVARREIAAHGSPPLWGPAAQPGTRSAGVGSPARTARRACGFLSDAAVSRSNRSVPTSPAPVHQSTEAGHDPRGSAPQVQSNGAEKDRTSSDASFVLPEATGGSIARHAELHSKSMRLIKFCTGVHATLQQLVATTGKLPAKRHGTPRVSGANTRTTVGLMLNGCAIDNVLPAMALHADLLKGDIIVKIDDQPTTSDTVQRQLIGDDVPGTTVMLTVHRGFTEKKTQLIRMANSDIADMRRVFEIFTGLKSRFPSISGEVDEVVTIWSEVVSGEALYRAQVANSMQRLGREGSAMLLDLHAALDELRHTQLLVNEAFDDARSIEERLVDVKKQLLQFGVETREQLEAQGASLREVTHERDALKDTVVDARLHNQMSRSQLDVMREESDSIKDRLREMTEERDSSRFELDKMKGKHEELRNLVTLDAARLRALEGELERAQAEADRVKGQIIELRAMYDTSGEQVANLQHEKRQAKSELEATKGILDALRTELSQVKQDSQISQAEEELRREELDRALGTLQATRDELQIAQSALARARDERSQAVSEAERTQGQILEIRRMLHERVTRMESAEIDQEKTTRELEVSLGANSELRMLVTTKEQRIEELLAEVGRAKAYQAEYEMMKKELETQRTRFADLTREISVCRATLEQESIGKNNAAAEKEGLLEAHERITAQVARLQAQAKDAEEVQARLQTVQGEKNTLKERLRETKTELEEALYCSARLEGQLSEAKAKCGRLEQDVRKYTEDLHPQVQEIEFMQGQVQELREQAKTAVQRAVRAEEEASAAKSVAEMLRGQAAEFDAWKRSSQDTMHQADVARRAAKGEAEQLQGQLDEVRAMLTAEKQQRIRAEAKAAEHHSAEEEKRALELQLSQLRKSDYEKNSRSEEAVREMQTQLIAKERELAVATARADDVSGQNEQLTLQLSDLREQMDEAQERSPKMTTLSRMLREQLTAKADALKEVEQERDFSKRELSAVELSLDIARQDLAASKKSLERAERARRQAEEDRDEARQAHETCNSIILELRFYSGRHIYVCVVVGVCHSIDRAQCYVCKPEREVLPESISPESVLKCKLASNDGIAGAS